MAALLILILICAILLAITGSMSPWLSGLVALACLAGLTVQSWNKSQSLKKLRKRRQYLMARWGVLVRHLGGLQLPLDTAGQLYLLKEQMLLETEHENLSVPLTSIQQILLTTADQVRRMPDRQLCHLLSAGNCRLFSALREKIRHHDSLLRKHGLLLIVYQTPDDGVNLLILATNKSPHALTGLFRQPLLADKIRIQLHSKS